MTEVIISIPTPLRTYTENNKKITITGQTIDEVLNNLVEQYPKLRSHLFEDGELRNFVNIYLNDEDIRYKEKKEQTSLEDGDEVAIIPSIAGGVS